MKVRSKKTFDAVRLADLKSAKEIKSILGKDNEVKIIIEDDIVIEINDGLRIKNGDYLVSINGNELFETLTESEFNEKYERVIVRKRKTKEVKDEQ